MKFLAGCSLLLALSATGCLDMPIWKDSKPLPKPAAEKPQRVIPPVTAAEIDETNGRVKAKALWDELDREDETHLTPTNPEVEK